MNNKNKILEPKLVNLEKEIRCSRAFYWTTTENSSPSFLFLENEERWGRAFTSISNGYLTRLKLKHVLSALILFFIKKKGRGFNGRQAK